MYSNPACANEDPELFFPEPGRGGAYLSKGFRQQIATAKAVCRGCDHLTACLEDNLGLEYGIAGGLTARERDTIRRQRGLPRLQLTPKDTGLMREAQQARRERELVERDLPRTA